MKRADESSNSLAYRGDTTADDTPKGSQQQLPNIGVQSARDGVARKKSRDVHKLILKDEDRSKSVATKERLREKIRRKADERRADLERRRRSASEEDHRIKARKYMHDLLAADFHSRVVVPEAQRVNYALAVKRQLCTPIARRELKTHAQRFDQMQKERKEKKQRLVQKERIDSQIRFFSVSRCRLAQEVVEKDKLRKVLRLKDKQEASARLEKQKQYTSLVREMFVPLVDPRKKRELEQRKMSLLTPKRPSPSRTAPSVKSASPHLFHRRSRAFPSPSPPPKKHIPTTDWLGEKRRRRDNYELRELRDQPPLHWGALTSTGSSKASELRARARELEKKARKRELLLSQVVDTNVKALEINENITDAYLASAKAKLQFLNS